jgi:molybdenum cofactor synthesis domain-containing protein
VKREAFVITVSDRSSRGERADRSGPEVEAVLAAAGIDILDRRIVPDDLGAIRSALLWAVARHVPLVLTTGGTGLAPRDVTPEATRSIIDREVPGLAEAMRNASVATAPFAMLSRAVCGVSERTLIINLPGSPRGARECLEVIASVLPHALDVIGGGGQAEHDTANETRSRNSHERQE